MFKNSFLSDPCLRILLMISLMTGSLFSAPYGPDGLSIEWEQPDDTIISLRVFGDEFLARTETRDGYTVVRNAADNAYYYAELAADGQSLVPSVHLVGGEKKAPVALVKHLSLSSKVNKAKWEKRYNKLAPNERADWSKLIKGARERRVLKKAKGVDGVKVAPQTESVADATSPESLDGPAINPAVNNVLVDGNYVGLTILVQFPDDPETVEVDAENFPTSRAKMVRYSNELGYNDDGNTGSVRDYFLDQSLNTVDYTQIVTPIITLPQPRNYYNWLDYPTNTVIRDGGLTGRLVIKDAIAELQSQNFDFTGLTLNNSNRVVATNVVFAGPTSGVWPDGLWPHRWVVSPTINVGTGGNNIYIYDYQITNARNSAVTLGTFCHENGHLLLKYPDLYDYGVDGRSRGVGGHGLMGGGNNNNGGRTPAPINGYFKDVSGWSNVIDITANEFANATLATTGNEGYRIEKPGSPREYFFIENRGDGDPWAASTPDKGILIWHIDEAVNGNENQHMTAAKHYEVSVEQADGDFDLENNSNGGDRDDLFDVATQGFDDSTTPNANWWDGSASGLQLTVLSSPGASMNVRIGVPLNDVLVTSPDGGELWQLGTSQNITWLSNIVGNVKIELLKNGSLDSLIAGNTANDGSYDWDIPANQTLGVDYRVRVTSLEPAAKTDTSDADFSIGNDPILADGLDATGFTWISNGDSDWFYQTETTHDDQDAGQSGLITHNQSSSMETTVVGPGTLTFWWAVSSESGYDHLSFHLDGIKQTGVLAEISGEVDWVKKTVVVPSGSHNVKWVYSKDTSVDRGSDAGWVDQVVFTPSAPSDGNLVVTAASGLTAFGDVGGPFTPSSKNYILTNSGGISINWTASNNSSWVSLSSANGTLAPGAQRTVTVSINNGANSLAANTYNATISFTNTTNGGGNTTRNVSLTVQEPIVISYNGNGNTGGSAPGNQTKQRGVNLTLAARGTLSKNNYGFMGWNTASNGNGTAYPEGGNYILDLSDTLYAQWNASPVVNAGVDRTVIFGGSAVWNPSNLSPQSWYDASDTSTISSTAGSVSEWRDKSGNGRKATQLAGANQPTSGSNNMGGLNVITFDGATDFLNLNLDYLAGVSHSAFIMTKTTKFTDIYGAANSSSGSRSLHVGFTNADNFRMNYWGNDWGQRIGDSFNAAEANLINFVWTSGVNKQIFANGVSQGTRAGAGVIGTMAGGGRMGQVVNHGYYGGDIAEIVFITGNVNQADRERMEGYLAHKWGVEGGLDGGHPYKDSAPSMEGSTISLVGTATDLEDDDMTYSWSMVSGPANVNFSNSTSLTTDASFTQIGTYVLRFTADDGFSENYDEMVVNVTAPMLNIYGTWSDDDFANPFTDKGLGGNQDGDGLSNRMEFGMGTDPTINDSLPLKEDGTRNGVPISVTSNGGTTYDFMFVRRDDHDTSGSIKYTPQFSSDMLTFYDSSATPAMVTDSSDDAAYHMVKVPYTPILPNGKKAIFGRIKVEMVP